MKIKYTSILLFCLAALSGYGQTEKGTFLLGGSLEFSRTDNTTTFDLLGSKSSGTAKTTSLQVSPNISYFVVNRLAVGIVTPFTYTRMKMDGTNLPGHTYAVGPIARYYFLLGSHWAIFPEASYTYGWTKDSSPLRDVNNNMYVQKYNGNTHELQLGAGGVYFLTKSIGIEGKVYYDSRHTEYDTVKPAAPEHHSTDNKSFNLSVGLQVYFAK